MAEDNSDDTPTDTAQSSSAAAAPGKKRRTSANPSSRGVANLTPEQLARKRANDREAQRAIRERTKNQIDRLNNRIRELESQQPYHELQIALRQKEAIQAENEDIRKRLTSILSIIQPILRTQGLNELAAAAERSPLPIPPPQDAEPRSAQQLHPPDPRSFHSSLVSLNDIAPPNAPASTPSPSGQGPTNRHWPFPGDPPTSHVRGWPGGSPPFDQQRAPIHHDMGFGHCDERLGVDFLLDGSQRLKLNNGVPSHHPSSSTHLVQNHTEHPPMVAYSTLPRCIGATSPLDGILLDFLADRQTRAAEGVPMKTLVGPLYPNFTALLYPDRHIDSHPLSKLFTDILRTFPDIDGLPEQVAIVFVMFLIMRWQIEPTQENYDRLPDWVTPRPCQLFTPHPAWMDHLPWPRLRDRMISTTPFTVFDTFFIPYTTTISLNWPYEPRDCLLPASIVTRSSSNLSTTSSQFSATSPYSTAAHAGSPPGPPTPGPAVSTPGGLGKEDEQWLINPAFESHLRNLNNWSLGPAFRSAFPHLADAVRIKEGR